MTVCFHPTWSKMLITSMGNLLHFSMNTMCCTTMDVVDDKRDKGENHTITTTTDYFDMLTEITGYRYKRVEGGGCKSDKKVDVSHAEALCIAQMETFKNWVIDM